jgi:hypothetical protein
MVTTIQVSNELVNKLKQKKLYDKESYEEIIWGLLEDGMELSEETKKHIKRSEEDIKAGKTSSLADVKKKIGIR